MGIAPWPGGECEKAYIHSFVGAELSFLKLGSVLGLSGGVIEFFLKASTGKITVFNVKCVFWPVD